MKKAQIGIWEGLAIISSLIILLGMIWTWWVPASNELNQCVMNKSQTFVTCFKEFFLSTPPVQEGIQLKTICENGTDFGCATRVIPKVAETINKPTKP